MKLFLFAACVSLASSKCDYIVVIWLNPKLGLQCYHCNSDNEGVECDTEKSGTLQDCPEATVDDIWVCATQQLFSTTRICMNLADEYERNLIMMGDNDCAGLYCNITDMEFRDLHQENRMNEDSFFSEYTRCVDRYGMDACFHYCDTGALA